VRVISDQVSTELLDSIALLPGLKILDVLNDLLSGSERNITHLPDDEARGQF
jgi:hypothetical protein